MDNYKNAVTHIQRKNVKNPPERVEYSGLHISQKRTSRIRIRVPERNFKILDGVAGKRLPGIKLQKNISVEKYIVVEYYLIKKYYA